MRKKKNAFTLIELLAVIVILAVILVISIPRILDVIETSKKDSFKNSAQLIADSAEKKKVSDKLLGKDESITCKDVAKINYEDYKSCIISFDSEGNAKVSITGKGKFDGLKITNGTKGNAEVKEITKPTYGITAVEYITNLYDYDDISNNLKRDNTKDQNIRYHGSDPNNYVSFNNELWRIIGVFGNNVKLVRKDSLGSLLWDSSKFSADIDENSGAGINQWGESTYEDGSLYEGADLQVYLNKMYYGGDTTVTCYGASGNKTTTCPTNTLDETSKALIDNHTWNVGAVYSSDTLELYKTERGTKIGKTCRTSGNNSGGCSDKVIRTTLWTGHVALPYITDWAYASSESICETNVQAQDSSNDYICQNNNWINSDTNIWTLSPRDHSGPGGATYVRSIGGNGYIASFSSAAELYDIYPTIYLKSNVLIESGNGTSSNPYILKAGA